MNVLDKKVIYFIMFSNSLQIKEYMVHAPSRRLYGSGSSLVPGLEPDLFQEFCFIVQ